MSSSSMYISAVLLDVACRFSFEEEKVAGVKPEDELALPFMSITTANSLITVSVLDSQSNDMSVLNIGYKCQI